MYLLGNGTFDNTVVIKEGSSLQLGNEGIDIYNFATSATLEGGGTLTMSAGTLNLQGNGAIAHLTLSNGTLYVHGVLTATNTFEWSGGTLSGNGVTNIAPQGTLNLISGGRTLGAGHTLNNWGTVNWRVGGISAGQGSVINNQGNFNIFNTNGVGMLNGIFTNTGILTKSLDRNTLDNRTPFQRATFNNSGTVNVTSGSLTFSESRIVNTGTLPASGITYVNNTTQVTNPLLPDLYIIAEGINAPNQVDPGSTITVNWRVGNRGSVATANQPWSSGVYFSTDNQLDITDIFLGRSLETTILSNGSIAENLTSAKFVFPRVAAGAGYLLFVADDRYKQFESDETNNIVAKEIQVTNTPVPAVAPDLVVTDVSVDNSQLIGNPASVQVTWKVKNQGTATATSWRSRIILSQNETIGDSDDLFLGSEFTNTGSLIPNSAFDSFQRTETVTLPTNLRGSYYIAVTTGLTSGVEISRLQQSNLLAYFPFEGNAVDVSGSGNNGIVTGATLSNQGYSGQAYSFNGSGLNPQVIRVNLDVNPSNYPLMSWGAWVKPSTQGQMAIISHDNGGFDRSLVIDNRNTNSATTNTFRWSTFSGSGTLLNTTNVANAPEIPIDTNNWTFIAATYNQTTGLVSLYVNDQVLTETGIFNEGLNYLHIGSNPTFGGYFQGLIDNVFIYNTVLSKEDLDAIRLRGVPLGNLGLTGTYNNTSRPLGIQVSLPANGSPNLSLDSTQIAENSAVGAVVGRFTITDPDVTDTHTLAIVNQDADRPFAIQRNQQTGQYELVVARANVLNYETKPSYNIRVRVTDSGGLSVEVPFTITVQDVNERPTNITLNPISVPENSAPEILVGRLTTTDPDVGDSHSYTLLSGNEWFTLVNGNEIRVAQGAVLDFESQTSYVINVSSTDAGGLSVNSSLTINLIDENEAPSNITLSANNIRENSPNGTIIGTFSTTDPDRGSSFTYELLNNAGGRFALNSNRLVVANSTLLDYEATPNPQFTIQVKVTDNGGLTFVKDLIINLLNAPDVDLQVDFNPALTLPASAFLGQTLNVSWIVTNNSNETTSNVAWSDRLYLSQDTTISNDDIQINLPAVKVPLAGGEKYTRTLPLPLTNAQLVAGKYYIIIQTDVGNTEGETNETNNQIVSDEITLNPAPTPDLTVVEIEPTFPTALTQKDQFFLTWRVADLAGNGIGNQTWVDKVYLSKDGNLIEIGSFTRNQASLGTISRQITIPENLADGEYELLVVTDANNTVTESDENNNRLLVSGRKIIISHADLVVSDVKISTEIDVEPTDNTGRSSFVTIPNQVPVKVSWKVTNSVAGIGSSNTWVDQIIAISRTGIERVIGEYTHTGFLSEGESYTRDVTVNLPIGFFSERYDLYVQTDATNQVAETTTGENNNRGKADQYLDVATSRYADLIITDANANLVIPDTSSPGGNFLNVSWTVQNQGIGSTNTNTWIDTVQLARNSDGTGIISTRTFQNFGVLDVKNTYNRSVQLPVPNGFAGPVYVVVTAGNPYEFIYTNNNRRIISSVIQIPGDRNPPNLQVTEITAPQTVQAGATIDVTWKVENKGRTATGTWVDRIALIPGNQPNAAPIVLGSFIYNNSLDENGSYTRTERLRVPEFIGTTGLQGLYQIQVITNANALLNPNSTNLIYEGNITDNTTVDTDAIQINFPFYPNLTVSQVEPIGELKAGGVFSVKYTVTNEGVVATKTPRWRDNVYLSYGKNSQGVFTKDIFLGAIDNASALAASESYTGEITNLRIPDNYSGPGYIVVEADGGNVVQEYPKEDDNLGGSQLFNIQELAPADLLVSDVVVEQIEVDEGTSFTVRYKVTNVGSERTISSTGGWIDTFWLAKTRQRPSPIAQGADGFFPLQDILLTTQRNRNITLNPGQSEYFRETITLPQRVTGQWYVTPWIDAFDAVREVTSALYTNPDSRNELDNNNYKASPNRLVIKPKIAADLAVSNVTAVLTSAPVNVPGGNRTLKVDWTVTNLGAESAANWQDFVYLVTDTGDRVELGRINSRQPLGAANTTGSTPVYQFYRTSAELQLPTSAKGVQVIVTADPWSGTSEVWEGGGTSEIDNNSANTTAEIDPLPADLQVNSVNHRRRPLTETQRQHRRID